MTGLVTYRTFLADSERWVRFEHRPGDIAISTPPKSWAHEGGSPG